jgi:hypothetical protein
MTRRSPRKPDAANKGFANISAPPIEVREARR